MEIVAETMQRSMEAEAQVGSSNYSDEPPYGVVEGTRRIKENTMVKWYLALCIIMLRKGMLLVRCQESSRAVNHGVPSVEARQRYSTDVPSVTSLN